MVEWGRGLGNDDVDDVDIESGSICLVCEAFKMFRRGNEAS